MMTFTADTQQNIVNWLKEKGIDAYLPAAHDGQCKPGEMYVVVKPFGTFPLNGFSSTNNEYSVMCYIHKEKGSELESFVDLVESHVDSLRAYMLIRNAHMKTPHFYDNDIKAHMIALRYTVVKRNKEVIINEA